MNKLGWQATAIGIVVLILFGLGFYAGYKTKKCPDIQTDTVYVHDTVTHTIINDVHHYHNILDTIIYKDTVFKDVDTAAILKDYYALHVYERTWVGIEGKDSLLLAVLTDTIARNKSIGCLFRYKILRPQTIINNTVDNTVTYNSYLYGGVSVPIMPIKDINNIGIELTYAFQHAYIGALYQPNINTLSAKAGVKLFKFKRKL